MSERVCDRLLRIGRDGVHFDEQAVQIRMSCEEERVMFANSSESQGWLCDLVGGR